MPLLQILTDPKNFKFYAGGPGHTSTANSFGQKSIPYGKDQFGGGWSKQPFVVKSIDVPGSQVENTGGPDILLRGGTLITSRILDDQSRLSQLLIKPGTTAGTGFTLKQNLLSRTSVRTQGTVGITNQGIYTPAETLLEAALIPEGIFSPLFLAHGNYYDVVKLQRETDALPGNNRLYGLYETKIQNLNAGFPGLRGFESLDPNVIMQYGGGPNAPLGVGRTRITFADQRTGKNNPLVPKTGTFKQNYLLQSSGSAGLNLSSQIKNPFFGLPTNGSSVTTLSSQNLSLAPKVAYLFSNEQIQEATPFRQQASNPFVDFRQTLITDPATGQEAKKVLVSTDYKAYNLQKTYNTGNPGRVSKARNTDPTKNTTVDKDTADLINYQKVGELNTDSDLIPFYFSILSGNGVTKPVQFRAYIDSFGDSFEGEWNNFRYMGRGENFYNYNGFTRTISMGFSIYAQTYPEIFKQYQRLNQLSSIVAPSYSGAGIMRGNLVRVTVGDYLSQVPGIIKSINIDIPSESPWETGRNQAGKLNGRGDRLPFYLRVSNITFVPIYDFIPQYESPFVSMGDNNQGYNN